MTRDTLSLPRPGGRRLVSLGRVHAPKPLNLPSQRKENQGADINVEIVPRGGGSWNVEQPEVRPDAVRIDRDPVPAWGGAGTQERRKQEIEKAASEAGQAAQRDPREYGGYGDHRGYGDREYDGRGRRDREYDRYGPAANGRYPDERFFGSSPPRYERGYPPHYPPPPHPPLPPGPGQGWDSSGRRRPHSRESFPPHDGRDYPSRSRPSYPPTYGYGEDPSRPPPPLPPGGLSSDSGPPRYPGGGPQHQPHDLHGNYSSHRMNHTPYPPNGYYADRERHGYGDPQAQNRARYPPRASDQGGYPSFDGGSHLPRRNGEYHNMKSNPLEGRERPPANGDHDSGLWADDGGEMDYGAPPVFQGDDAQGDPNPGTEHGSLAESNGRPSLSSPVASRKPVKLLRKEVAKAENGPPSQQKTAKDPVSSKSEGGRIRKTDSSRSDATQACLGKDRLQPGDGETSKKQKQLTAPGRSSVDARAKTAPQGEAKMATEAGMAQTKGEHPKSGRPRSKGSRGGRSKSNRGSDGGQGDNAKARTEREDLKRGKGEKPLTQVDENLVHQIMSVGLSETTSASSAIEASPGKSREETEKPGRSQGRKDREERRARPGRSSKAAKTDVIVAKTGQPSEERRNGQRSGGRQSKSKEPSEMQGAAVPAAVDVTPVASEARSNSPLPVGPPSQLELAGSRSTNSELAMNHSDGGKSEQITTAPGALSLSQDAPPGLASARRGSRRGGKGGHPSDTPSDGPVSSQPTDQGEARTSKTSRRGGTRNGKSRSSAKGPDAKGLAAEQAAGSAPSSAPPPLSSATPSGPKTMADAGDVDLNAHVAEPPGLAAKPNSKRGSGPRGRTNKAKVRGQDSGRGGKGRHAGIDEPNGHLSKSEQASSLSSSGGHSDRASGAAGGTATVASSRGDPVSNGHPPQLSTAPRSPVQVPARLASQAMASVVTHG